MERDKHSVIAQHHHHTTLGTYFEEADEQHEKVYGGDGAVGARLL